MTQPAFVCVVDPLQSLNPKKDSTVAMMESAQARGWKIGVIEDGKLSWSNGTGVVGQVIWLHIDRQRTPWYQPLGEEVRQLKDLTAVVMRKDPPFDTEYVTSTWLLEQAEREGAQVFNRPSAIRDHNEKFATAQYPEWTVPALVSRDQKQLSAFLEEHPDAIVKPLEGMGGRSIFRLQRGDANVGVILETLTEFGQKTAMIQKFIPEIDQGDKRILLVNGEPAPYALARLPKAGEHRGNLAAGGTGRAQPLSETDRAIALEVGPGLAKKGLLLVGLDVIGQFITEVNVTSPTCFREIQDATGYSVADSFVQAIESRTRQPAIAATEGGSC